MGARHVVLKGEQRSIVVAVAIPLGPPTREVHCVLDFLNRLKKNKEW
jgi:hypothetical protein